MGSVNLDNTGSGSAITLSSDGTSLLLDGTAIGGGGGSPDLYAENPVTGTNAPVATGTDAVAIGFNTTATGSRSFAIGLADGDATGSNSFAVGGQATNSSAIAIANGSSAQGMNSVSIGNGSRAQGTRSVALGSEAKATTNSNAIAIGWSLASGSSSFAAAITNNTTSYGATGANSIAMGQNAKSTGNNNVAIGQAQSLGSDYAIAIGYQAKTTNHSSIAIGREAGASGLGDESLAIGFGTYASGGKAIALGRSCRATGSYSVAIGSYANTNGIQGKFAFSVDYMNSTGDAQQGKYILHHSTTDATPRAVTSTGSSPSTGNQVNLRDNSAYTFSGTIVGREKASEGTDVGSWEIKGIIRKEANAGTTVLVNSVINEIFVPTGWAVAITADTTNGCLKVEVTGVASTNIRWVAIVNTAEVYYP